MPSDDDEEDEQAPRPAAAAAARDAARGTSIAAQGSCVCDACVVKWKSLPASTASSAQAFVSVCAMMASRLGDSGSEIAEGGVSGLARLTCTASTAAHEGADLEQQLAALADGASAGLIPDEAALKALSERFEGAEAAGSTQEGEHRFVHVFCICSLLRALAGAGCASSNPSVLLASGHCCP